MSATASIERAGSALLVRLSGDLDAAAVPQVGSQIAAALESGRPERLVLALGGVSFLDSTGLGLLIRYRDVCHQGGISLFLRDVTPRIRRLLEITGLDRSFRYEVAADRAS